MDQIFKALNDPARRALLDSLRLQDGQTLSQLEAQHDMTRFGVMKHLGVLEDAGLITTRRAGRFKHHFLNAVPLQDVVDRWIEPLLVGPTARGLLDLKNRLEGQPMKPDFVMNTFIRCSQDALWDALTDVDKEVAYHFIATRIERDGNRVIYYTPDDALMLVCTETKVEPKTRIEATFEPAWEGPDMASSRYVYLIEPKDAFCQLTIEHYDLPDGQEGIADGWARMLAGLKTWLETGETVRFSDLEDMHA
ncbi:MAG: helix-turn-helix domain-containing protein [Pseudomonadota bacterium]